MAKQLVVYYSRKGENHMPGGVQVLQKGNTAYAAEYIARAIGADLFEIDTVKPYAENYRACCGAPPFSFCPFLLPVAYSQPGGPELHPTPACR